MKLASILVQIVVILLIALWGYTAFNKILDHNLFVFNLYQSPLSSYAKFVSYAIPVTELGIVALLLFERYRRLGLILSFVLLTIFTIYIVYILNFATDIPCSCGGFIESLTWTQHVMFNLSFMTITLVSIIAINRMTGKFRLSQHT